MTDPIIIGYDPRCTAAGDIHPGAHARDAQGSGGQDRLLPRRVHEDLLPACSRAIELRSAVAELGDDVDVETDAVVGDPAEVLVDLSQQIDLLVCGSRGDGPVRGVLLGSVSRRIVREAHCPVMVLPRGVKASLEELLSEAPGAAAPA